MWSPEVGIVCLSAMPHLVWASFSGVCWADSMSLTCSESQWASGLQGSGPHASWRALFSVSHLLKVSTKPCVVFAFLFCGLGILMTYTLLCFINPCLSLAFTGGPAFEFIFVYKENIFQFFLTDYAVSRITDKSIFAGNGLTQDFSV